MFRVRRIVISALSAIPLIACEPVIRSNQEPRPMYGLIGKIRSVPGQRDALASILIHGTSAMPGCLSYVVAIDGSESDALGVTAVWDSSASHRAFRVHFPLCEKQSLKLTHSLRASVNALKPSPSVATAYQLVRQQPNP